MDAQEMDTLVARYGRVDADIKALKKSNDADKELIKNFLAEQESSKWTAGGYTVQRVVSNSETMNEGKLLALMQKYRDIAEANGIIKTMEYVDTNALETAIYQGQLSQDILTEMKDCHETKTTVSLRCVKAKEA